MYVIAATNVPPGRFAEETAPDEATALGQASTASVQHSGVAFTVFNVRSDGACAVGSFLNGEQRFTAL